MQLIDGEIWLEISEVGDACSLSYDSIRVLLQRDMANWQSIKDPKDRRRSLIRYNTISPKYKTLIKKPLDGNEPEAFLAAKIAIKSQESGIIEAIDEAHENYKSHLRYYTTVTAADTRKTEKVKKYLARAAACTEAIFIYYQQEGLKVSNRKPLIELSAYLKKEKKFMFPSPYGYMNTSVRHLQEALKAMDAGTPIDEIVKRPRMENENRLGESHGFLKGAVARLLTSGKNPTIADVTRKVQFLATKEGFKKPSQSIIYKYVAEMQSITALERFGDSSKASQKFRTSIPLAKAMYAGDCWEMDGTRVQIQPFNAAAKGEKRNLQYLYIVAVRDVYSSAFLGWSFALAESGLMYTEALKMAVSLAGHLPYELRYDKFPGHNSDNIERLFNSLENKGVKMTKTSVAAGKAHVERGFGTLQSVFESDRKEWVGQGIRSSRNYARPTTNYLAKVHKELMAEGFDWHAAWQAENEVIMTYNHTPINLYSKKYKNIDSSPMQLHDAETEKPNTYAIENFDIADLFWPTRKIGIRNYQLSIEVNRTAYTYMLTDEKYYDIIRNHDSVLVRFDPSDMSEVMLFDTLFNNYLNSVSRFQEPQLYGANPEYGKLAEEKAKIKVLTQRMAAELQETKAACDADVLGISIGHLIGKEKQAAAENSAMAQYWLNQVPIETPVATKSKNQRTRKVPSPQERAEGEVAFSDHDAQTNILNQL